jgi:hypothetical protein
LGSASISSRDFTLEPEPNSIKAQPGPARRPISPARCFRMAVSVRVK